MPMPMYNEEKLKNRRRPPTMLVNLPLFFRAVRRLSTVWVYSSRCSINSID
jgi:hypothetical protein